METSRMRRKKRKRRRKQMRKNLKKKWRRHEKRRGNEYSMRRAKKVIKQQTRNNQMKNNNIRRPQYQQRPLKSFITSLEGFQAGWCFCTWLINHYKNPVRFSWRQASFPDVEDYTIVPPRNAAISKLREQVCRSEGTAVRRNGVSMRIRLSC